MMSCGEKVKVGVIGAGILGTKHVEFCMKHPDVDVVAVADLVKEKAQKLAEKAGVKLMVGYGMRWYPTFTAAHVIVREGYIGDPLSATMIHNDRIDVPEEMWGPLAKSWARNSTIADFLGSHDADLIRWISGKEAESVYARSTSKVLGLTPDGYNALVTFEGGFQTSLNLNWIAARSKPNLVDGILLIYGSEGTIQLNWHGRDIM